MGHQCAPASVVDRYREVPNTSEDCNLGRGSSAGIPQSQIEPNSSKIALIDERPYSVPAGWPTPSQLVILRAYQGDFVYSLLVGKSTAQQRRLL